MGKSQRVSKRNEQRLQAWEASKGFKGVFKGDDIYRMCSCGRATEALSEEQCPGCGGKRRSHKRTACATTGCEKSAGVLHPTLCRACWFQKDADAATAYYANWHRPLKRRTVTTGFVPKRCQVDGCSANAHFNNKTMCELCWVRTDPVALGCPRCQRNVKCRSRDDQLCGGCRKKDETVQRRAAREARLAAPPPAADEVDEEEPILDSEPADLHLELELMRPCDFEEWFAELDSPEGSVVG